MFLNNRYYSMKDSFDQMKSHFKIAIGIDLTNLEKHDDYLA